MAQIKRTPAIILLLLILFLPLRAQKGITVSIRGEKTVKELFTEIERQTGYSIAYNHSALHIDERRNVSFHQLPLSDVLHRLLEGSGYTYKIKRKHILIVKAHTPEHSPLQNIRGKVLDAQTQEPVFATIRILNPSLSGKGTATDSLGNFHLAQLPISRYALQISGIGYDPVTVTDVLLNSAKEAYCEVMLKENTQQLQEVIIRAPLYKSQLLNPMTLTGGRMLSMEEASRYAGGFDDPARLVSSFAGVTSSSVSSNALEVRGNAPQYVQWRMEGIETPNFSHFADVTGLGGGMLTGLSSHVINHSDFLYSAFPAEYSNALAGVFDMNMRTGNTEEFEHAFQFGVWGLDAASEGPIGKKGNSSYLFNYRYSFSGIADKISGVDEGLDYQDLSFKINMPTRRKGTFSLWGVGLLDHLKQKNEEDTNQWEETQDRTRQEYDFQKGILGLTHHLPLPKEAYLKSIAAITYSGLNGTLEEADNNLNFHPMGEIKNNTASLVLSTYYNRRYSARHTNRSGITLTGMNYQIDLKSSPNVTLYKPMVQYVKENGQTAALSAYTSSLISLSDTWKMNLGITAQYFALNHAWSVEPRAGLKWQVLPNQSLALAYGLHSRRERTEYYFTRLPESGSKVVNSDLKFSKAHHLSLAYNWTPSPLVNIKVEPYVQYLYNLPVEENSSFSIINYNGYILDRQLVNKGKGLNYGIDVTLERYLNKGWYWMLSGSLFRSRYMGGDHIWRDSRMDRRFMLKALAGKEWTFGRNHHKSLSLNLRMTFQGGERYTPIDYEASDETHEIEEEETKAYTLKLPASFVTDLTVNYKINRKHVAHEFSLKLLNANGFSDTYYRYNLATDRIEKKKGAAIVPNISYKLYF